MSSTKTRLDPVCAGQTTPHSPRIDLLPRQDPDDNLLCGIGTRAWCVALRLDQNRMSVAAGAVEQTRITYGLTRLVAKYDGLNITGVRTHRTAGVGAHSHFILSTVSGVDPIVLRQFGEEINRNPWFDPCGRQIKAAVVGDLTVIARDRPGLLMDELAIVSGKYDANIESLLNEHYGPRYYPTLKPAPGGGRDGRTGRGGGRAHYRYSESVSFTRMTLELEAGTDIQALTRDLVERGREEARESGCPTEWNVQWEERRPQKTAARDAFGSLN